MRKILFLILLMLAVTDTSWLTIDELAERWRMPASTLRDWRLRRYGPQPVRLGRGARGPLRYKLSDVEHYETERQSAGAA